MAGDDAKTMTKALFWRQCVEELFNGYAKQFDTHLQEVLKYDAPERLRAALVAFQKARPGEGNKLPSKKLQGKKQDIEKHGHQGSTVQKRGKCREGKVVVKKK